MRVIRLFCGRYAVIMIVVENVVRIRGDGRGTVGYGLGFCHLRFSSPKHNLNTKVILCSSRALSVGANLPVPTTVRKALSGKVSYGF